MIIIMGVLGAGKSLQAKMLADKNGYTWLSTGEILRAQHSEELQRRMNTGVLLTDEEMYKLLEKSFAEVEDESKIILDGFPRTLAQAEWLLDKFNNGELKLTTVLNLLVGRDIVVQRLLARRRNDDTEEAIKTRFDEYETKTLPILDFFRENGIHVVEVNAGQTPEAVHDEIMRDIAL